MKRFLILALALALNTPVAQAADKPDGTITQEELSQLRNLSETQEFLIKTMIGSCFMDGVIYSTEMLQSRQKFNVEAAMARAFKCADDQIKSIK